MRKNQSGFTLIEIAVVVLIIGILSSIAVVNYNKVRDKAEADLKSIGPNNVATSVLADYITTANMTDIPEGMNIAVSATPVRSGGSNHFSVQISITSDASHTGILNELQAMFPRTLNRMGEYEWVAVDSKHLAVQTVPGTR